MLASASWSGALLRARAPIAALFSLRRAVWLVLFCFGAAASEGGERVCVAAMLLPGLCLRAWMRDILCGRRWANCLRFATAM